MVKNNNSRVAGVFMLVSLALATWYLIDFCFKYDNKNCVDILEDDSTCQKEATYIALLSIIVIGVIMLMIGMVSLPKRVRHYKRYKRSRR